MQQTLARQKPTPFETLCAATVAEQQALYDIPVISQAIQGNIKLTTYVAFLTQAYHHVKHTVPLLMLTGSRISHQDEWLRTAMAEYIDEELGHEQWILNDIKACGGDPEQVAASEPAFATELMVAYTYDAINRISPLTFLGLVHVLEGTSVAFATQAAKAIKSSLALPNKAFSYLISHGDLDQGHTQFFEELINKMTQQQLAVVINACKRFYRLYADIFRSLPTS